MHSPETINIFPQHDAESAYRWSEERANDWYERHPWIIGCNYIPANAINQLEMWQADTFDLDRIRLELGWASDLGFNTVRVFLHHLLWEQDPAGFLHRIDQFLAVAENCGIKAMLVLFDSVWDPNPRTGKQPEPKPHVHNSGWVQSPGMEVLKNTSAYDSLSSYVQGIVERFKNDPRVLVWDLYNEPDNQNLSSYRDTEYGAKKAHLAMQLLKKTINWVRVIDPVQPLTAAPWNWSDTASLSVLDNYMFNHSDVITFHCYENKHHMERKIQLLKAFNRPILCTEYMARPFCCTFEEILPLFKKYNIGAYNWGLVSGKTQTHCAWDSWETAYKREPELWFHDVFKTNGEPYDENEVEFIKNLIRSNDSENTRYMRVA